MSIFAKPQETSSDNQFGVKVLFLHGLEGSPSGSKSRHFQEKWGALVPHLRTSDMISLKEKCSSQWYTLDQDEIEESLEKSYSDAVDAVKYSKPDIVIGSSLGAALLFKMYAQEVYTGPGVLLAPAIPHLLDPDQVQKGIEVASKTSTFWVLGETDTVVSNTSNVNIAKHSRGNITFSENDCHRLHKALETGLLDNAVLTIVEIEANNL